MTWKSQQAARCPTCRVYEWETNKWHAESTECPACADLNRKAERVRSTGQTLYGTGLRLFYQGVSNGE